MSVDTYSQIVFYGYIPFIILQIITFLRFLCRNVKAAEIMKFTKTLHIICFLTIILTSSCDMVHAFAAMVTNSSIIPVFSPLEYIKYLVPVSDSFYYIGTVSIYIILVQRLYTTFRHSIYKLSKYVVGFIALLIITQSIWMFLFILNVLFYDCDTSFWCHVLGIQSAIVVIIDYIINTMLLILFIKKLKDLLNSRFSESIDVEHLNVNSLSKPNSRLLNLITKQTIIGILMVLTNQLFGTFVFFMTTWNHISSFSGYLVFCYLLRGAEGSVVCYLLYVGFGINNAEYMKVCGCCHQTLSNCCIKSTRETLVVVRGPSLNYQETNQN
eukprot:457716_1